MSVADADREWTLRATEILTEVAGRYGRTIEYADLGAEVQRRSGILTDMPFAVWLDDVLREVGSRCREAGKPALSLLVDDPDSKVDPTARQSVYESYGAKVPRAKTSSSRSPRTRSLGSSNSGSNTGASRGGTSPKRTVKPAERRRPLCPTCFVELPSTGVCDNCE
ncbi:hypothetical protein [Granulicoccus sp. GXG6511]|uniref:hypothetical protein n=1 Tax=Granulicoccus sp. GXG6511 TaxID=3381351 RepID=UPI003D7D832A